MTVQSVCPSR